MRVPDLESMIDEVCEELSAKENAEEVMELVNNDNLKIAKKIFDAGESMNLLKINQSGNSFIRWVMDSKTQPVVKGGSVTSASGTNLRIAHGDSNIPPRLTAPLIPSTLGDKSSFKPGRRKKRAKS